MARPLSAGSAHVPQTEPMYDPGVRAKDRILRRENNGGGRAGPPPLLVYDCPTSRSLPFRLRQRVPVGQVGQRLRQLSVRRDARGEDAVVSTLVEGRHCTGRGLDGVDAIAAV